MNIYISSMALCLTLVLSTTVSNAAGAENPAGAVFNGMYKWVDVKGVIHYSDRPARSSEKVREERGIGRSDLATNENPLAQKALANDLRGIAEQRRTAGEAEKVTRNLGVMDEARVKACQNAKESLRVYSSGGRISTVSESGEKTFLSDSDIQSKQMEASKSVDDVCSPAKAPGAPAASSSAGPTKN